MGSTIGSLDTNILLRLLLNDLPVEHDAVVKLFEKASGQFMVADIAFMELAFVLQRAYGFTRLQVVEAIDGLAKLKEINCNRALLEQVLPLFVEHPALSFEDCSLAAYAKLNEAEPLWTFDKKLANQATNAQLVAR